MFRSLHGETGLGTHLLCGAFKRAISFALARLKSQKPWTKGSMSSVLCSPGQPAMPCNMGSSKIHDLGAFPALKSIRIHLASTTASIWVLFHPHCLKKPIHSDFQPANLLHVQPSWPVLRGHLGGGNAQDVRLSQLGDLRPRWHPPCSPKHASFFIFEAVKWG